MVIFDQKEYDAQLVETMLNQWPWNDKGKYQQARFAITIATRAIRRGRHLTDRERLENLAMALEEGPFDTDQERAEANEIASYIRGMEERKQ